MKRLTTFRKEKLLRLIRARRRKEQKRKARFFSAYEQGNTALAVARDLFQQRIQYCEKGEIEDRPDSRRIALVCPQELNIQANFQGTLGFFANLQHFIHLRPRTKKRTKYVDFCNLKTIDFGSLLVLAAELDMALGQRSKQRYRNVLLPADVHLWQSGIAYLFQQFGILELTGYRPREGDEALQAHPYLTPIRFRRDTLVKGSLANDLVQDVSALSVRRDEEQGGKLYTALTEAMTNTNMHAYPVSFTNYPGRTNTFWWGGAIYDRSTETAHFVMYDRGVGLPKTIPKRGWARSMVDSGANSDSALVKAALTAPRSSTGEPQHGKGLRQMAEAVDHKEGSFLRIISGKAVVTYRGDNQISSRELPVEFGGTLIEWSICDRD
ncbi:MAG: hypothetical protein AAF224_09510 [Pseudomonadota bacterium]